MAQQAEPRSNCDILRDLNISESDRFEMELEFVQCLANPEYLTWLAQTQDTDSKQFLAFLRYLEYWKRPEYSHHVTFPYCLELLDHLQQPEFRAAIRRRDTQTAMAWQLHYFFTHFRTNRLKEEAAARAATAAAPTADAMDES